MTVLDDSVVKRKLTCGSPYFAWNEVDLGCGVHLWA